MARVEDWEQVTTEVVGEYDIFDVRRHESRSPRTGEVHEFHVLDVPSCVKIIPFTRDGRVVMVEQFRHAVQRVSLEFPAGVMEDGEDPVDAGRRELEEETGYRPDTVELLTEFDPDPSIQSNAVKVILARGCTCDMEPHQDSGEDVAVRLVPVEEVGQLIANGEIRSAAALSAWTLYERMARSSRQAG